MKGEVAGEDMHDPRCRVGHRSKRKGEGDLHFTIKSLIAPAELQPLSVEF